MFYIVKQGSFPTGLMEFPYFLESAHYNISHVNSRHPNTIIFLLHDAIFSLFLHYIIGKGQFQKTKIKNMMKQKIYFVALLCATLFGFTSCLSDSDDDDDKQLFVSYYTITGTYPNYKLIGDNKMIVYPTVESVNKLTDNKGFGDHKRAQLYAYYTQKDMTTENGATVIRNAELNDGVYLVEQKAVTLAEATEAGILKEDSIFYIKSNNGWLANGYISSIFTAEYSIVDGKAIEPDANLCATSTGDNAVTLTMLYNRHSPKVNVSSYDGTFAYSFDITSLEVPGNDSITVTFETKGATPSKIKVSRQDFSYHAQ